MKHEPFFGEHTTINVRLPGEEPKVVKPDEYFSKAALTAMWNLGLNPTLWQKAPNDGFGRRSSALALAKLCKRGFAERKRVVPGQQFYYRLSELGCHVNDQLKASRKLRRTTGLL